jgi:hypothetical protein
MNSPWRWNVNIYLVDYSLLDKVAPSDFLQPYDYHVNSD